MQNLVNKVIHTQTFLSDQGALSKVKKPQKFSVIWNQLALIAVPQEKKVEQRTSDDITIA